MNIISIARTQFAFLALDPFILKAVVSPKVASERLRHSSLAFTMDTYSHIIEGMQEEAMKLLDELLPNGNNQSNNYNLTTISVI